MDLDKIIGKCVLSTLAAVATLLVFMMSVLCIFFPGTMMGITYNLGMENSSIHFAERAYKSNEDIYFISYATDVAIAEEKQDKIISCGQRLMRNEDFAEFCAKKGDGYDLLIARSVIVAKYKSGDKENAINDAFNSLNGGFPATNAVVALLLEAINAKDKDTVSTVVNKLNTLTMESEDLVYAIKWGNDFLAK